VAAHAAATAAVTAALRASAAAALSPAVLEDLRARGIARLPAATSAPLLARALREVNRQLGASAASPDVFRAKTFAERPEVTALFNDSMLPFVAEQLLGPLPRGAPYRQATGQLALRGLCERPAAPPAYRSCILLLALGSAIAAAFCFADYKAR
jgi:hypothetical protein